MKRVQIFFKRNSPTILTCIGAVGVIATAVLSVTATPKAMRLIQDTEHEKGDSLSIWETVKISSPCYIPSAITCLATLSCIFGANALNRRQQASLMSAYMLLDRTYRDYVAKTRELFGSDADSQIRTAIAKDKLENKPMALSDNNCLFYDMHLGCYCESSLELVEMDDGLECYIVDMKPIF